MQQLLERYNAFGPRGLGDRRQSNGANATVLSPAIIETLRERLKMPTDGGGLIRKEGRRFHDGRARAIHLGAARRMT